ncbi:sodium/proline symporter PutP [Planctomycetota bacterium]
MQTPVIITFVAYLVFLLGIGLYFWRKNRNLEDYLLGGRGMGAWVTALSAQASDMSGWLLMGLPGAIYLAGLVEAWIAIGLFVGTVLNWLLVSGRLRVYTQATQSITLPSFLEARFADPTGLLRIFSALIILIFFTIYASSGLVAAGKLFESTFGLSYTHAVWAGGLIIVGYTFLGGFLAVCWTDLFQGLLMVLALIVVPVLAYRQVGGMEAIRAAATARGISWSLLPQGGEHPWLAIISTMAWGLGYFGQPHILARFMSAQSVHKLRSSTVIAVIWVLISLTGAVAIGLIGIGMFGDLDTTTKEHEKVFIHMIPQVVGPWWAGVMLAAILSAIMSTIDSQLLVSSSALTEDFYQKVIKKEATEKELIWMGRLGVVIISLIALTLALHPYDSILGIVAYAWAGFGAAFGPVILFALFSRQTTWQAALLGMVTGTVVMVVWKRTPWAATMYEIVPGFVANCLAIMVTNMLIKQNDASVQNVYDGVLLKMNGNSGDQQ